MVQQEWREDPGALAIGDRQQRRDVAATGCIGNGNRMIFRLHFRTVAGGIHVDHMAVSRCQEDPGSQSIQGSLKQLRPQHPDVQRI